MFANIKNEYGCNHQIISFTVDRENKSVWHYSKSWHTDEGIFSINNVNIILANGLSVLIGYFNGNFFRKV